MISYYAIICVYVFYVKMTYCAIQEFSLKGMGIWLQNGMGIKVNISSLWNGNCYMGMGIKHPFPQTSIINYKNKTGVQYNFIKNCQQW